MPEQIRMSRKPHVLALLASLFYGVVAGVWILFSDRLLGNFVRDKTQLIQWEIYKGWAFVVCTGILFFFILRQLLAREEQKIQQLKKAEALADLQRETLEMMARSKPLKQTLDRLLRGVEALSPDMICSILLLDPDGIHLRHGAAPSLPEEYTRVIDGTAIGPKVGSCGTAAFRGSPVFVSDIANDPLWADFKQLALPHQLLSCWSTPILDEHKKVLGTFAIYHRNIGMPSDADVRVIEMVAHTATTAIEKQRAEKTLHESDERFRTLVEQASDAIFVHDVKGRLLDVNRSACESLGYSRQELLQMSVLDIELESQLKGVQEIWRKLKPGHSQIVRGQHRRKDGTTFPVEVSLNSYELQGQLVMAALARDLSGRKEYEEQLAQSVLKLHASEALYSSLVEQMPAAVFRKDAEGRFVFVNSRFCAFEHLPPDKIIGHNAKEVAEYKLQLAGGKSQTTGDINEINYGFLGFEHHKTIMRTGQAIEINEEYTLPSGEKGFFQVMKSPVFDSKKNIIGSQGVMFDITEHKRIEEKLRQADERAKFYMSRLPLAFIAWDEDFCVTEWNSAAENMFGWTAAEAIGQHAYKIIVPPDIQPMVSKLWQDIIAGGNLASHSINDNISKDGRRLNCEWRNMPLRNARNQICGCLSIVEDITERVRGDKQRNELESQLRQSQKMEAIGQLSGGVAHDFNNILTIIQGNAALLQNLELQPEEIRDASSQISRAAERAAGLTRQLLLFARKQQMQLINLDLNETVAQITKMLQRILGEDITLRTEYAPALPLIQADTGMIEQILLNLAVNARDAMKDGAKQTIRTSTEKRPSSTPGTEEVSACLQVADNGTGIAPDILPRIFEPFFTTKEVGKGTGLGLATVYGIIQQHHGTINVHSELGKGTNFKLSFPASHATKVSPTTDKPKAALPWGTETILLVEDELALRTFVSDLLQRCGYTVLEAESGPAALKIWAEYREKIDLLFTDVIMPEDMNGIELGRRLLAEKSTLKVIYTSGYTGNLEGRRTTLVEGSNFIRKPFKPDAIASIIRNKLDGKIPAA